MARPRVFISSTFYDLKQVRADLEHFIREIGYDPILNEHGAIPYGSDEKVEEYAYLNSGKTSTWDAWRQHALSFAHHDKGRPVVRVTPIG